jgi:DNA-binding response OmpR family regulator
MTSEPKNTGKTKILLVEDEKDILITLQNLLESEKYAVITATDGMEALDKVKLELPDLIILDLMIPKLDGYKVCRLLKFNEQLQKIPIIIITARAQEEDIERGKVVGADFYLTKPFDFKILASKIKELLKND